MSSNRRALLISLMIVFLLFLIPAVLVLWIGRPGRVTPDAAAANMGPIGPIAGPPPPTGLPDRLILWPLLTACLLLGFALGTWLVILLLRKKGRTGSELSPRPALILLAALGGASLLIYGVNFLLPFPLSRYYNLQHVSMGMIADREVQVALGVALATVALFLFYGLACRLCRGRSDRRLWAVVLLGALLFALFNFFVAIVTTLDLYDYIGRGRIAGVHGGNPYVHAPKDYPGDPFMQHVSWQDPTSAYGPLWEAVSAFLSRFSGDLLWPNVLAYKGLCLLSYAACVLLIAAILRRVAPGRALSGTLLFAWNPLILLEGVANGHNDLLMVALFLGAFWILAWRASTDNASSTRGWGLLAEGGALVLLGASVLVKFVPILFFPLFLLYLLADRKGWWRRIRTGLLLLLPVLVLIVLYYLPFGDVGDLWVALREGRSVAEVSAEWPGILNTFTRRGGMFRMSVPSVAYATLLDRGMEADSAQAQVNRLFLSLLVLTYLGLLLRAVQNLGWLPRRRSRKRLPSWQIFLQRVGRFLFGSHDGYRERPWNILLRACYSAFLLYLLFGNFWFWPWYLIWPIALLALNDDERTVLPMALASCAGQLGHLAWNFTWYWWGVSWETLYQIDALVVFWMVVPALFVYLIGHLCRYVSRGKAPRRTTA